MRFASLQELESKLRTSISENGGNKVERLAIDVHGMPGHIDVDGKLGSGALSILNNPNLSNEQKEELIQTKSFGVTTFAQYKPQFTLVAQHLAPNATLIFMSCNMGAGSLGSEILKKLSAEIFRGVRVVAFIKIGGSGQIAVKSCMLPGMKVTESTIESGSGEEAQRRWLAVKGDPWASEKSPGAKVALNGNIIKNPDGITPQSGPSGTWSAETGNVHFLVVIEVAGADPSGKLMTDGWIYWADNYAAPRHYGRWKLSVRLRIV
jgi:hypothetical protein